MAVVTPASWAASGIDSAVPSDPAPLLAIGAALAERRAVAPDSLRAPVVGHAFEPGDALRYPVVEALRRIMLSIRDLQGGFVGSLRNYAAEYWATWPDYLESVRNAPRPDAGVRSTDALAVDPPPPMPEPGESDWAVARYRAFLGWAKRSISAMSHVVPENCWAVGEYSGAADPPTAYTPGAVGGEPTFRAEWSMIVDHWEISRCIVPAGLVVVNRNPLAATAGAIMCGRWPQGLSYDPVTRNWTGNAPFFAGAFGPISQTVAVPAYGQAQLLSASATLAASGAVLPAAVGDGVVMYGILRPFLDYSASFRFP